MSHLLVKRICSCLGNTRKVLGPLIVPQHEHPVQSTARAPRGAWEIETPFWCTCPAVYVVKNCSRPIADNKHRCALSFSLPVTGFPGGLSGRLSGHVLSSTLPCGASLSQKNWMHVKSMGSERAGGTLVAARFLQVVLFRLGHMTEQNTREHKLCIF